MICMKTRIFSFLLIFSFVISVAAQTKEARKIDEFGSIECEELRARLDNFLSELQNTPQAKGFLIVYEGKYFQRVYDRFPDEKIKTYLPAFGEANYRTQVFLNHFKFRNSSSPDSYLFVSGGYRENHTVEMWIVPNGTIPPKPTPTLDKMKYRKGKPLKIVCNEG